MHLLRHGKVHNPANVLYGRLPGYRLAASGRAMADGVAEYLAGADITYLAASSLQRAQETAAPIASRFGLTVVTDDRVIEADNDFEGAAFGINRQTLGRPQSWTKLRNPRLPSWGEPYLQIAHRMLAAIYSAVDAADGHEAVLVSHQLPIVTARRYLEGKRLWHDPRHRTCSVASLTSLTFADGVFTGASYAEPVAHIAAVNDPVGPAAPVGTAAVGTAPIGSAPVGTAPIGTAPVGVVADGAGARGRLVVGPDAGGRDPMVGAATTEAPDVEMLPVTAATTPPVDGADR